MSFLRLLLKFSVGILLGRSVLGIVEVDQYLEIFSSLGVVFLVFLSGMEIDFTLFKGKKAGSQTPQNEPNPLKLAGISYASMLLVSLAVSLFFHFSGLFTDYWLLFIIFSSIALGIVVAFIKRTGTIK